MRGKTGKEEAWWELKLLAEDIKNIYLHGFVEPDMQYEIMLRRLVKITDHLGGPRAMNYVFGGAIGAEYSKHPVIRWLEKINDLFEDDEIDS